MRWERRGWWWCVGHLARILRWRDGGGALGRAIHLVELLPRHRWMDVGTNELKRVAVSHHIAHERIGLASHWLAIEEERHGRGHVGGGENWLLRLRDGASTPH